MRRFDYSAWRRGIAVAATLAALAPHSAQAEETLFDELRFGASASVQTGNSREDGVFPEATVFFDPFGAANASGWSEKLLRPRVNIGASIGTSGQASQLFSGLSWQVDFSEKIFVEAGFGGVIHDGEFDHNSNGPDLGCRVLFHEYVGAGYRFDRHWNLVAQIAHSSHANLCDGPNDGMTRAGLQIGYKF